MNNLIATILIIVISSSKYSAGLGIALISDQSLLVSYLANIGGGLLGITAFIFFGGIIKKKLEKNIKYKKTRFNWKNRSLVKVRAMGLTGVAFLTPILLSIPLGILVSLSLTSDKKKIFLSMMISCIFWTTLFFILYYMFGLELDKFIHSIFNW